MPGYLEGYGAGEEAKARRIRWVLIGVPSLLVLSVVGYYSFRHYPERQKLGAFLGAVESQNLASAYEMWGCLQAKPCKDYNWERFTEDWGAKGEFRRIATMPVTEKYSCVGGIVRTFSFGPDKEMTLYIDTQEHLIHFAPPKRAWKGCTILP